MLHYLSDDEDIGAGRERAPLISSGPQRWEQQPTRHHPSSPRTRWPTTTSFFPSSAMASGQPLLSSPSVSRGSGGGGGGVSSFLPSRLAMPSWTFSRSGLDSHDHASPNTPGHRHHDTRPVNWTARGAEITVTRAPTDEEWTNPAESPSPSPPPRGKSGSPHLRRARIIFARHPFLCGAFALFALAAVALLAVRLHAPHGDNTDAFDSARSFIWPDDDGETHDSPYSGSKVTTDTEPMPASPVSTPDYSQTPTALTPEAPTTVTIVTPAPTQPAPPPEPVVAPPPPEPTPIQTPTSNEAARTPNDQTPTPPAPSEPSSPPPQPPADPTALQHGEDLSTKSQRLAEQYLPRPDLVDSALQCPTPVPERTAACDFSWGPPQAHSSSTAEHTREEIDPAATWKQPQDLYTFQAGLQMTGEGPGALVRIMMRDLCCVARHLPLSYFRVEAHGAAQAASNPPLALGERPVALGRGHQPRHLTQTFWGADVHLRDVDESRVLQTFLLLPDPGHYKIVVKLIHYNVSVNMVSETFGMNSKEYDNRPGLFVDAPVRNARGENSTHLFIHETLSYRSRPYTDRLKGLLPLCGMEGGGHFGGASNTGTRFGMPLAGRWVYQPQPGEGALDDRTHLDHVFLVEHSEWQPYFCALDHAASFPATLEKIKWLHFTGDSNTRHIFFYTCELANGTLISLEEEVVPRRLDPPHMCFGPSSTDNRPDSETGLATGSNSRWVLTYTSWFWGKLQTLTKEYPFEAQCSRFVALPNPSGLFYGWPQCTKAPDFIRKMTNPGTTYFSWGSHAAELGANDATRAYFATEEAFHLPHFYTTPTIFPLTTANAPNLIPGKFGRQQSMRNNERVHASNLMLVEAVIDERLKYATLTPGGSQAHANSIPILDLFSPTHAAYADLTCDAVHFNRFFSFEMARLLIHFVGHATNFGPDIGHK